MLNPTAVLDCTRTDEILVVALELSVKEWKIAAAPLSDPARPRLTGTFTSPKLAPPELKDLAGNAVENLLKKKSGNILEPK